MKHGYLIELKYIKRGEYTDDLLQQNLTEARKQLKQYANDARIVRGQQKVQTKCLTLVFCGWELKVAKALDNGDDLE